MDIAVVAILASLHMQGLNANPQGYNQVNPGIAIEIDDYAAGFYKDSYSRATSFVAWSPYHGVLRPFLGAAEGYQGHIPIFGKIAPIAGLDIEPWHKEGPTFLVTPMNLHGIVIGFAWKHSL